MWWQKVVGVAVKLSRAPAHGDGASYVCFLPGTSYKLRNSYMCSVSRYGICLAAPQPMTHLLPGTNDTSLAVA